MTSSTESRIISMKFVSDQFMKGVSAAIGSLDKLKTAMDFGKMVASMPVFSSMLSRFGLKSPFGSLQKGVQDLQQGVNGFTMHPMEGAVSGVSKKFIALTTVAVTALSNIVTKAVSAGTAFVKSFTTAPIMDGLREYETNLKSIQTVQANTDRPLKEVEASLEQLNKYSDQTIYNFSEMARNVGTFTAAGVDLKTSVSSIKGIANIAALSGSSSQQAATAMYQLSQAISSGKVGLQDWNSVVNAGMGGKKLQNALAQTAIAMGDIDKNAVKMVGPMKKLEINGGSFRESIMAKPGQESWLSSDILVNTLATMDGRFSKAALKAELTAKGVRKFSDAQIEAKISQSRLNLEQKNGVKYTDEQFAALQKMSTQAFKSATEVKTLGQVFDIAKETVASGWSASFKNIFGNLKEAKELFTGMSNGFTKIIRDSALARNNVLADWAEAGGRDFVILGLTHAWTAFSSVVGTLHDALRDVFPAKTGQDLADMSAKFASFMFDLIPGKATLKAIGDIARGFFSVLHIGVQILQAAGTMFVGLFKTLADGSGGFLDFAAGIGNSLTSLDKFIQNSGLLEAFFKGLGAILAVPLKLLTGLGSVIAGIFSGFDAGGADKLSGAFDKAGKRLEPLATAGERVKAVFEGMASFFDGLAVKIGSAFDGVGEAIVNALSAENFGKALDALNTGLLAGILLMIKNFMSGGSIDVTGGFFSKIGDTLDGVTGALENMQTSIKADILTKIAIALGILTASIVVLSLIDPAQLSRSLVAMSVGFAGLQVAMVALSKAVSTMGVLKLVPLTSAILTLAAAMLILSLAVKVMSTMNLWELAKGLGGMAIMLGLLVLTVRGMGSANADMVKVGAGLLLLSIALKIMASAVQDFADMSWGEMIQGLVGLSGALVAIAAGMKVMPKNIVLQSVGLVILASALKIIASAVGDFAALGWGAMVTGFSGMAIALGIMAAAMRLMPANLLVQATGLLILSAAITVIGNAIATMGGLDISVIAKGLTTLALSLVILAAGLYLMTGSLAGAAALVLAAGALALMVPVLIALGAMTWEGIAQGLVMLGGTFIVLAAGGMLLAPVIPVLAAFSVVMLVFGAGMLLAGVGMAAFGAGFAAVVTSASVGVAVLSTILKTILASIPTALRAFGAGIVAFAGAIARGAPQFFRAFGAIIQGILRAVIQAIPKIGQLFQQLLTTALRIISNNIPKIIAAGFKLIVSFLNAISKNIGKITNIAADIIVKFLNGIAKNIDRIIQSGVNLIIKFVDGVTKAINNNSAEVGRAGGDLAVALVRGMATGIANGLDTVAQAAKNLAGNAFDAAMDFLKAKSPSRLFMQVGGYVSQGMAIGIDNDSRLAGEASKRMAKTVVSAARSALLLASATLPDAADVMPTITPILDLSQVTAEAGKIGGIVGGQSVSADVSLDRASSISADQLAAAAAKLEEQAGPTVKEVKFEQNNYSPRELSATEIYRNTRSQIALAKEVLVTA